MMGSEDVEIHCQTQTASANVPCESGNAYGIATVPFAVSVSAAHSGNGTPVSAGTVMLAQSGTSHTPPQNMPSVAASPLPQVQVIQQPLQNQYLQQIYAPQQQHMFLPGNLTIQPTIQSIGGAPAGISLHLQGKAMENKGATAPTIISAGPMQAVGNFGAQNIMPAGGQMQGTAKACLPGQMLASTSKSTAVIQGQSGFIPATTSNQTVVIGQLGVLSNPQSVMPHQAKAIADSQKGKSYLISQPATLHPKSPILPSNASNAGQMISTSQLKQLPSAPHIVTSQAPTMIANQAQILGSLQTLNASLPPGLTWATPGSIHSSPLFGQNPIFIRSQQSDMFIQTPPQATLHVAPASIQEQVQVQQQAQVQQQQMAHVQMQQQQQQVAQLQMQVPPQCSTPAPQQVQLQQQLQVQQHQVQQPQQQQPTSTQHVYKTKVPIRPGSSVATQTSVSTSTSSSTSTAHLKSQSKAKRVHFTHSMQSVAKHSVHLQTATTQTQTQPPLNQKADASNQTRAPQQEHKLAALYNKIIEPFKATSSAETTYSPPLQEHNTDIAIQSYQPQQIQQLHSHQIPQHHSQPIQQLHSQQSIQQLHSQQSIQQLHAHPIQHHVQPLQQSMEVLSELQTVAMVVPTLDAEVQPDASDEPLVTTTLPMVMASVPVEKVLPNRKDVEMENIATSHMPENVGIVMPMPEVAREKQHPQRAIVKPHVLTHVIEGFVIQEGSEPFPVSMPSYSITNKEENADSSMESYSGAQSSETSPVPKKKEKNFKIRSGVELAKCEYCGKLGPKAKFKRSKRFCSTSCAKRFNAGFSKRLSIILPDQDLKSGDEIRKHKKKANKKGKSKKKKLGLKSKKNWKKSENKLYEDNQWNVELVHHIPDEMPEDQSNLVEEDEEMIEEVNQLEMEHDSSAEVSIEDSQSASLQGSIAEQDSSNMEFATKSPMKWTVKDVFDFIHSMPGCSDYADEFRAQEIDGQALLLLKEDHLMSLMSMKLGPALKVCARISSMKQEMS